MSWSSLTMLKQNASTYAGLSFACCVVSLRLFLSVKKLEESSTPILWSPKLFNKSKVNIYRQNNCYSVYLSIINKNCVCNLYKYTVCDVLDKITVYCV